MEKGRKILLDDGKILLEVIDDTAQMAVPSKEEREEEKTSYLCTVLRGGILSGRKSIAMEDVMIQTPTLTGQDMENLHHAKQFGVTGVMQPFVRNQQDLGYMYEGGAKAMLKDMETMNRSVREHYPELPLILMGHSMGSLAVRAFAAEHDDKMDMLIVCGSPSKNPARSFGELTAKVEKAVRGGRHRSHLLETLSFSSYVAPFRKEHNKNAWICSDPEVYLEYDRSPLCGFTFTDDGYLALFELMKRAYDTGKWHCTNPDMPVLFIGGAEDPCIGGPAKYAKAVQAMRRAGYRDVKGKLYRGMRHEILNEKEKEKVYHDIVIYMEKKGF